MDGAPESEYPRLYVERTLALVKPDAIHKAEEIEDIILKSGFVILQVGVALHGGEHSECLQQRLIQNETI